MPIAVAEGKRRPHEPVQAAKFASEAGVIIRDKVPVLPHWKEQERRSILQKLCGKALCKCITVSMVNMYICLTLID